MPSGEHPELSPHTYEELNERLRAKDRDGAIESIDRLLASGRPIGEILSQTSRIVVTLENSRPDGSERPLSTETSKGLAQAVSSGQEETNQSAARSASPSILERLFEHSGETEANQPTSLGENLNGVRLVKTDAELRTAWRGPHQPEQTARDRDIVSALREPARAEPSPVAADEPHPVDSQQRPGAEANSRWRTRLIACSLATGISSAAVAAIFFMDRAPEPGKSSNGQYVSIPDTPPAAAVSANAARAPAEASIKTAVAEIVRQDVPAQPYTPAAVSDNANDLPALEHPLAAVEGLIREPASIKPDHEKVLQGVADAPETVSDKRRVSETEIPALILRGDALLTDGDIISARLFYQYGADAGNSTAALRLGATFDPAFLSLAQFRGVSGNPAKAAHWYRRAQDLGNTDAGLLLKKLEPLRK